MSISFEKKITLTIQIDNCNKMFSDLQLVRFSKKERSTISQIVSQKRDRFKF